MHVYQICCINLNFLIKESSHSQLYKMGCIQLKFIVYLFIQIIINLKRRFMNSCQKMGFIFMFLSAQHDNFSCYTKSFIFISNNFSDILGPFPMNLLKKTWVRGATGKDSSMEHDYVEDSKQPRVHLPLRPLISPSVSLCRL